MPRFKRYILTSHLHGVTTQVAGFVIIPACLKQRQKKLKGHKVHMTILELRILYSSYGEIFICSALRHKIHAYTNDQDSRNTGD